MCQTKDNRLHANTFRCQTKSFTEDTLNLCGDHNHNHRKYYGLSRPLLCYTNISVCVFAYVSVLSSIEICSKLFVLVVIKIVQCRVPLSVPSRNRLITLSTRIVHQSITTELPVHAMVSQIEHTEFVQPGSLTQNKHVMWMMMWALQTLVITATIYYYYYYYYHHHHHLLYAGYLYSYS